MIASSKFLMAMVKKIILLIFVKFCTWYIQLDFWTRSKINGWSFISFLAVASSNHGLTLSSWTVEKSLNHVGVILLALTIVFAFVQSRHACNHPCNRPLECIAYLLEVGISGIRIPSEQTMMYLLNLKQVI